MVEIIPDTITIILPLSAIAVIPYPNTDTRLNATTEHHMIIRFCWCNFFIIRSSTFLYL